MPNDAGNSLATATRLALSSTAVLREDLAEPGVSDFYQVNLAYRSSVSVAISGFSGDVDLRILDRNGNLVTVSGTPLESSNPENFAESITTTLNPGLYFIEVSGTLLTEATEYTLTAVRNSGIPGDILWRQTVTGETVAWDMEGTQRQAVVPVTPAQPAPSPGGGIWQVQATGDLNNDGNVDLLWRNSTTGENRLWLMNGANLVQEIPLLNVAPTSATSNWRMQGVGDFNQDGRADILWRNYVTGENIVWYMNGGERLGVESLVNTGTPTQWEIQGVGDFNQDGQPDILWRNQVTGENRLWLMEQLAAAQNLVLLQVVNLNWRIQGVGDFTGDGQPDILWRNFQTGDNVVWEMNGADRVSVQPLLPVTTTAWRAYAPYNLGLTTPSPADTIGNSLATAFNVGSNLSAVGEFAGFAGATDQNDYYRFSIDQLSRIRIDLAGLAGNLDLELLSSGGTVIQSSAQPGNVAESIIRDLAPGQYFLRVFSTGENSNYNLVFDINNFPVLAVNTPLAVDEGALGTISSAVLQVTDTEDSASELTYTVTTLPSNGTLLLNGFSLNGVNSFTQADLDNGLLTYQHDGSETLTDSFTFTVADSGGASFNNVFTFAINPVNDPPGLSVNQGLTVNEGQSSNLQALISVTDNDNPATELTYSIVDAPVNGVLSLGGAPLGDRSFTQADVDLGRVLYRHNGSETLSDRFTFTVVDLGGASLPITTFNIQVNPVNDPPRVGLNAGLVVDEGASGNLQGVLQITDDDNGDDQLTFTLEATPINGILLLDGSTELTAGSTFTQDDINNSRLTYRHNGSEIPFDSFTFVVRDPLGATLPSTAFQITVNPVNDSPELTVPPTQAVDQNASTGIPGISIADPDADPGSITVTLQVQNGNLSLGSAAGLDFFSGNNTRQLLLTGTLTAVNNALNTLLYISDAAFRGTDTVVVNVNDNGNTGLGGEKTDTASFSLNVAPVNQPPAIALPVTPPQVREDEVTGISGISITDPDAAGGAITVALIASNGTLSLSSNPGVIFVGDSSGRTLVFSGSLGVVNTALNNLRFVGDQDYNGPASITITVNDNGNTGNGTARSDVQTLNFNISPVNDAPVLTLPGSAVLASEDIQTNIPGIRVDDVDAGDGILSVELVVGNGVLSLGSLTGLTNVSGNNTRLLTFEGTLATINNALQTLRYLGDPSFNGTDNLQIAVSDNGNTGAGFARTTTGTVAINIVGLNSPPAINLPSGIPETAPNTNLSIPTIFITDPDVGDGLMEISLRVGNGRLTVNPAAGITFLQGTSEQGNRITFEGTIGAINGTLATLVYRGNPGFIDAFDTLEISVSDRGNTGVGTALSDFDTLRIRVGDAVNQLPVVGVDNFNASRNRTLTVAAPGVRANDFDPNGDPLTLSLSTNAANGTVSNFNTNGSFIYVPNPGFIGTDSFVYAASDGIDTVAGTVFINVTNNVPVATSDTYTFTVSTPQTIPVNLGVLANDSDPNNDPLVASLVDSVGASGSLALNPNGSFVYTPPSTAFSGVETFTYKVNDGLVDSNVATILITVSTTTVPPINQPPVANNNNYSTPADTPLTITLRAEGVLANDTDPDTPLNQLTATTTQTVTPNGGSLTLNPDGTFAYTPATGFSGTDSFTYFANDGALNSLNPATVFITVGTATNQPPVANNNNYSTPADTPLTITLRTEGVLANDTDPDTPLEQLTATTTQTVTPNGGSLTLNPDGTFAYTPATGFSGIDSFTYFANDGALNSLNPATVFITVGTATNQPPVANNNNYSTPANTPLTITLRAEGVLANDTDPDTPLDQLTATTTQTVTPNGGSLTLNPDGTFAYTPATGFSGIDSFTYFANDGALNSLNPATVFITVGTATNQPPVANDNSFRALPSTAVQPFTLTVGSDRSILLNDSDPDNDPLTATIITPPAGTLANFDSAAGTFTYVPVVNFTGVDSFVYQLSDGSGGTATATVLITVAANTPPAVQDLLYTVVAGGTLSVDSNGGINPTDAEGDLITLELVNQPTQGTVTLNPDGSFIYTPTTGTIGAVDSFTYLARDEFDASPVATVTLTFVGNSPPQAVDDTYSIAFNRTLSAVDAINRVTGNDFDPDPGTTFTTSLVTDVTSGTLTFNSDGTFIYNPAAGTAATVGQVVTFVYELSDNFGATDTATVSITVTDSTILVANDDNYTVSSGQTLSPSPASQNGLLDNDALVPGTTATITVLTQPTLGQLTVPPAADGSFTYVPNQGATGVDSFTYQFGDGTETSGIGTAFITISTNQAPVAVGETFTAVGDRPFTVTAPGVLANDSDPDNDPLSVNIPLEFEGNNGPGFLDLATDGSFVYRPPVGGFVGTATFVYAVSDGSTNALATLTLNLTANAAPIAQPTVFTVNRGNTLTPVVGVLDPTFVSDPDGDVLTATLTAPTTRGTLTDFNPTTGTFTYVPDGAQFPTAGTDSFVYQISDGSNVITQTATISVVITSAPPVADNDSFSGDANNPLTVGAIGVLEGDTDPDGDVLAVANPGTLTTANSGVVTLNADGSFIYQPAANFVGTDSFTYQATDGINLSNLATVEITVGATNNPPQLQVPGAQISLNRAPVVIPPIVVSDRDAGNNPIRVSLRGFQVQVLPNPPQPVGTLSLASLDGLTIVNGANNSGAITIEGTITALNAALATLTYTPPASGQPGDTLTELPILVSVNDLGFTGGTGTPQTQVASVPIVVSTGESLITDINRFPNATNGTLGASPQNLTPVGNVIYFTADDGFNGVELWRSDGTAGGTILVADINPLLDGAASSEPRNLTVVGDTLYFTANDGTNGRELWRLNLTSPGAEPALVTDINPAGSSNPSNLVALPNGTLFFQATNAQGNRLVYRLDGDTAVAVGSGYVNPTQLTLVGNTLYFVANNETELWRSDGTTAGTVRVQTIAPGASVQNLVAIGNILYFVATDAANGRELWRSDGTAAGTTRISNINPGTGNADPNNLVNLNGVLYFFANNGTTNGLYRTTPAGGVELVPGTALPSGGAAPRSLTVVGNTLFFVVDAGTPANPNEQLWAATTTGITGQVRDINPFGSDNLQSLTNVNGKLFFVANDSQNTRIWQSDGTTAGTTPLTTNAFNTGPVPANITAAGNRIFFTAAGFTEEDPTIDLGVELWRLL